MRVTEGRADRAIRRVLLSRYERAHSDLSDSPVELFVWLLMQIGMIRHIIDSSQQRAELCRYRSF